MLEEDGGVGEMMECEWGSRGERVFCVIQFCEMIFFDLLMDGRVNKESLGLIQQKSLIK